MKNLIFVSILLTLIGLNTAHAAGTASFNLAGLKIEPILGYETIYRDSPKPHTLTRNIYGGRLALGSDLLAAELEYTVGKDTEYFTSAPEKIESQDEKGKLGVRSTYRFNNYFFITGRVGGQGTKGWNEETSSGVVTRTDNPIKYHPYAGASLGVSLGGYVSISAGTTVVFKDNSDMAKNDVQNTVSISVGVNN